MGPTRFPYGHAIGFQNQFQFTVGPSISGTAGLISGSTAPNVTLGELFYVNNTGNLTITNFILDDTANRLATYEGKVIRVISLDTGSTSYAGGGPLNLVGSDNLSGQNVQVEFLQSRGQWYQTSVSKVGADVTTFVTNAQSSLNMRGVRVAILNNTGSTTNSIIGLSNGYVGQEVTFMLQGSNAVQLRFQAGGGTSSNMVALGTNSLLINASSLYKFVMHTDLTWRALAINSAAISL